MAWVTITTDTSSRIDLGTDDSLFVAPGATLDYYLLGSPVTASGTGQWLILYGSVMDNTDAAISAIGTSDLLIEIAESGYVGANDAVFLTATIDTAIENAGVIQGSNIGGAGISLFGSVGTVVLNDAAGVIEGETGVYTWGGSNATTLINLGTIVAPNAYYEDGTAEDTVINAGLIIGDILLGGGDDLYDGRLGTLIGTVWGGAGNDRILTCGCDNTLFGEEGNDILAGGAGADELDGGTGSDVAHYGGAREAVVVSLAGSVAGTGWAAGDTFTDIERLAGSRFGDWLEGDDGDNVLAGGGGDDTLLGGLGRDTLVGGTGADRLEGGGGIDRAGYGTATAGVVASLADPTVNTGDAAGDSYLDVEGLVGSAWGDDLRGDSAANTLWGGQGDDTLTGGRGQDTLYGGADADAFVFASSLGTAHADRIADFETGIDEIRLDDAVFATLALGTLDAAAFAANDDGLAQEADDRIVYETDTGFLTYDADGAGGAAGLRIARLGVGTSLSFDDLVVV